MKGLSNITVAILARGFGPGPRPAMTNRPEVLAEAAGRPFIFYLLDQLAAADMRDVVVCTGYFGHEVKEVLGGAHGPLRLIYSQESSPLGIGSAIRLAIPQFLREQVLVVNGGSFCEGNLRALALIHRLRKARATILLVEVSDPGRFEWVEVDAGGAVRAFLEKEGKSGPGWINAGIYLVDRSLLQTIPPGQNTFLEKESFPAWVGQGLYGFAAMASSLISGRRSAWL